MTSDFSCLLHVVGLLLFFLLVCFFVVFFIRLTIWLFVPPESNPHTLLLIHTDGMLNSPKLLWPNLPTSVPCGESPVDTAILKLSWLIKA